MSNTSFGVRRLCLAGFVLAAVAQANLATALSGRVPSALGVTRIGRDLVRKSVEQGSACQILAERMFDGRATHHNHA
jgi:hypothetical protein